MFIYEVTDDRKNYLDLLLLADEQEDMIDLYLEKGTMFVLDDEGVKGECVVTDEGDGILEIKNIATLPDAHGKGYGRALLDFAEARITEKYDVIILHASLPAKNIYLKRGFREVDYLKIDTGYGDFLCADVMEKKAK